MTGLTGRLNPGGSVKSTKWKITWLPTLPDLVPLTLVDFAHLITKKKVEEDDVFEDLVNPVSVSTCRIAVWSAVLLHNHPCGL